jgi:hypothetical protein
MHDPCSRATLLSSRSGRADGVHREISVQTYLALEGALQWPDM